MTVERKKGRSLSPESHSAQLLLDLGELIKEVDFSLSRPGMVVRYGYDGAQEILRLQENALRQREFYRLQKRKLIRVCKKADEYRFAFSAEGLAELLRLRIKKAEMLPEGKLCIVVFDIPESQRLLRKQIRDLLSRAAFIPLQKSVWASPFDAGEALTQLFPTKKGRKWVRVFIAEEL